MARRIVMDKIVYIPSIVLGTILAMSYCWRCWVKRWEINTETAVHCFLCGPSIVVGFLLLAGSIYDRLLRLVGINIYMALAGFLVLLLSWQKLCKYMTKPVGGPMEQAFRQAAAGKDGGGGERK